MDSREPNIRSNTILLSGASGLLGTALRRNLDADASVLRLVRHEAQGPGDLRWNPASTTPFASPSVLEGITAAIHLSGANVSAQRWTAAYKREMIASRVDSTRALATALASLESRPEVLLVASATGIYGDRGDELLDEGSAFGSGFLADLCRAWEEAALPAREAGIRVVHLRFGVVLAPGGGALGKMLPLFRMGLGGPLGNGRQWMSWIGLPDLIGAVRFLMHTASIAGPVNLTSPQSVTNAEFTRALGRALHRPAFLPAPAPMLRLAFGEMAEEALLSSARVLPQRLLREGFQFAQPDLHGALQTLLQPSRS